MDVATNCGPRGDQLSHFMTRAMTLQSSSESKVGSFVGCTARFDGTAHKLKDFISIVTLYKDMEGINDEIALHELYLLLEGEAATWWAEVKIDVHMWSEALRLLQRKFLATKQAYEIYNKIFSVKQDGYIPIEIFIKRKRALFDELPRVHSEEAQIDMIYSLLKLKIQSKIPRESIATFDQLIREAQRVEHSKYKKRVQRFKRFDLNSFIPVGVPTKICSHYRECDEWGNSREVECRDCRYERRKRVLGRRQLIPSSANTSHIPLRDFKPHLKPFM